MIWRATNVSPWLRVTIIGLLRSKDVGDEPSQTLDELAQRRGKLATDRGELVGDARRNGRLRKAPDQAVPDEGSEGLREHLLADALDAVAQQMEAQRSFAERHEKQEAPAAGDVVENRATGTLGRKDDACFLFRPLLLNVCFHAGLTFRCVLTIGYGPANYKS